MGRDDFHRLDYQPLFGRGARADKKEWQKSSLRFLEFRTNRRKNPTSHAQTLASPASRKAVKSRIPSRYLSFCRFPHRILVKSRIPRTPFQLLLMRREDVLVRLEREKSFGDTGAVEKFELIGTIFVPKASHPS